ncbi:MAG: ABC transporter permease, partial [Thermoanaerobaculia bacterium]
MTSPAQHLDALARDARFALRVLRKSPVFTTTAVLTLALGIGANATVFSMVDTLLLRSLPYPEPDRLAVVSTTVRTPDGAGGEQTSQDGHTWEALRDHAELVDLAVSGVPTGINFYAGDRAVHLEQQRVSAGFFRVLGVAPRLGREFTPEEDRPGGPAVAVLSHGLWQRAFGGDPSVVGESVLLRGEPHTVVGVMPEGFRSTFPAELWTPLRPSTSGEGGGTNYQIVARLEPGASWEQAGAEVDALARPAWHEQRQPPPGVEARFSLMPLRRALSQGLRWPLFLLWSAVGLVLVVVCANLAGLMLARTAGRSREVAARIALGGGRGAVVRQVLVESLILAGAGGLLGLAFGTLGTEGLSALARDTLSLGQPVAVDARVAWATMALALLTSLAFGLWPALQVSRLDPKAVLAGGGGRGASAGSAGWSRRVLVTGEIAVGMVLLVFAGLLARTFVNLRSLDPGFDPEGVVAGTVSLQDARYETRERITGLVDESLERIRRGPGMEGAAVSLGLPYERLLNLGFRARVPDGGMSEPAAVSTSYVTPDFFETLRIPLLRGRTFEAADGPGRPRVAVVNERFMEDKLPEGAGLGSRFELGQQDYEIVGVVG